MTINNFIQYVNRYTNGLNINIAENVPLTYWYDNGSGDFLVSFSTSVANSADPLMVYSIGYGAYESLLSSETKATFNTEAMKAAVRGVTYISAAGNDGVTGKDKSDQEECHKYDNRPLLVFRL